MGNKREILMRIASRTYLGPFVAVVTLLIGLAFVWTAQRTLAVWTAKPPTVVADARRSYGVKITHTVERSRSGLSCYDPTILPIWTELRRDSMFRKGLGQVIDEDCSEILLLSREDFNGDGIDEIFVIGKHPLLCGPTANCYMWLFNEQDGHWIILLRSAGIRLERANGASKGYQNVNVRHNGSSYPDSLRAYRFERGRYRLTRCYEQDKRTLEKSEATCDGLEDFD
jgi:hypothetical protein